MLKSRFKITSYCYSVPEMLPRFKQIQSVRLHSMLESTQSTLDARGYALEAGQNLQGNAEYREPMISDLGERKFSSSAWTSGSLEFSFDTISSKSHIPLQSVTNDTSYTKYCPSFLDSLNVSKGSSGSLSQHNQLTKDAFSSHGSQFNSTSAVGSSPFDKPSMETENMRTFSIERSTGFPSATEYPGHFSIPANNDGDLLRLNENISEKKQEFYSTKQNEDFSALEQLIEDLTQEKFSLQRSLEASRTLAESLAAENSSLKDSYNQQIADAGGVCRHVSWTINRWYNVQFGVSNLLMQFIVQYRVAAWFSAKVPNFPVHLDCLVGDPTLADSCKVLRKKLFSLSAWSPPPSGFFKVNADRAAELQTFKMEYANARLECNAADERANILASEVIGFEEKALRLRSNELKLERQLENSQAEISSFKKKMSSLEKERQDFQSTIEALQEEKKVLQSKLRKASAGGKSIDVTKNPASRKDMSTSTEDLASVIASQPLSMDDDREMNNSNNASSLSLLPEDGQFEAASVFIPPDQMRLTLEKEELAQALSSELSQSSKLKELNNELSLKLEAPTQRLELLTAQSMASGGKGLRMDYEALSGWPSRGRTNKRLSY
ncbi:hypothetical protein F3Y22_tig00111769pilonHSYRG00030 [Hibiscus syriacus]|uniref:Uncharacterized protein n=1 Tax=Hibiscus syriacus TaxID=106335 RepID=A0A6A2XDL6_HIBSY|nr:hypothetical protein F3Y22_tig00111769pilonHSYRG00030 [Hibiscus syriacus]